VGGAEFRNGREAAGAERRCERKHVACERVSGTVTKNKEVTQ